MKFANLAYLWFLWLIPAVIFFFIWGYKKKQDLIHQFVSPELRDRILEGVSFTRQKIKILFIILAFLFAIISLIRPKWGFHWEEVHRKGVDIIIALDVSKSMLAEDVSPNRLQRAQREILDLLNIIQGDRVGLVAFAGTSFLQSPLTLDYGAVKIFLDDLDTNLIPIPGTAIADAIKKSIESFDEKNQKSRVLILITDGEDHLGKPIEAAKEAAAKGIKVYTIGIGNEQGAPIPDKEKGGFVKDSKGSMVLTQLDEETLQKIALETGGSYVRSVTGDLDLEKIYEDINKKVEDQDLQSGKRKRFEERFQWPLFLAILFLMIELCFSERKKIGWFFVFIFISFSGEPVNALSFSTKSKAEKNYENKRYADALGQFLDAQMTDPENLKLKYNLGNTYFQTKEYEKAEKMFLSTAVEGEKELSQKSYYNLGNTYYHMGKLKESVESFEKAVELDPTDEDAKHNLEFVREEIKRRLEEQKKNQQKQQEQQEGQENKENQENQSGNEKNQQQEENKKEEKDKNGEPKDENKEKKPDEKEGSTPEEKKSLEKEEEKKNQDKKEGMGAKDKKEEEKNKEEKNVTPSQGQENSNDKNEMSDAEAMRWFNSLNDQRKDYLKRKLKDQRRYQVEKDW